MFIDEIYSVCIIRDNKEVLYTNQFEDEIDAKYDFISILRDFYLDKELDDDIMESIFDIGYYSMFHHNKVKDKDEKYSLYFNKVSL